MIKESENITTGNPDKDSPQVTTISEFEGFGSYRSFEPHLTRFPGGRIKWRIVGNTLEQDEQLGINNIQALFLEKFPEFNEIFPRDENNLIQKDNCEEAKKFISERIGTDVKFRTALGLTRPHAGLAPYFKGRVSVILSKSFLVWGLEFKELPEVNKVTGKYIDERGQTWVTTNYLRVNFGLSGLDARRRLNDVAIIQGRGINRIPATFYNEEQALERLKGRIENKGFPQINSGGEFIDIDGNVWVPADFFQRKYSINPNILQDMDNFPVLRGRDRVGRITNLYNRAITIDRLNIRLEYRNLPMIDSESGTYTDENGDRWISLKHAIKPGVGRNKLLKLLEGVTAIKGRDLRGKETLLYSETELSRVSDPFLQLPFVETETGVYRDSDGTVWAPVEFFQRKFRVAAETIKRRLEGLPSLNARSRGRFEVVLYPEPLVQERITEFLAIRVSSISPEEANEQLRRLLEVR